MASRPLLLARALVATIGVVAVACACGVEILTTPPANPGVATAPAEVVALAGPDVVALEGARVQLGGEASRALAGEPELSWSQREGPPVVLSNPSAPSPSFIAPLAPARLVFVLTARADALIDADEVSVDIVDRAALLPAAPRVQTLPADQVADEGELAVLTATWTGAGTPSVSARCDTSALNAELLGQELVVTVAPLALPCPIVVDDLVATPTSSAGRAALTLWPAATTLASPTRIAAPAVVGPGAELTLDIDDGALLFSVDGVPLTIERDVGGATFVAPRRPGRLTLLVEHRVEGTSGGARAVAIEVSAGADNAAPVVDAGPDLRVRPGARFRVAPSTADDDGDDVALEVRQVLGPAARQGGGGVSVLVAPDVTSAETLLFHVVGDDGAAESAPETVRVVVDPSAENIPPIVTLPAEHYVTPGASFTIDASGARDPDAGLVVAWRIVQDEDDTARLLEAPRDEPRVTLVAGAAGERYRFVASVIDDGGLEASATTTVIVEAAGPYVDVARGLTDGDGTVERPFLSIDAAAVVAARHRFPALIVAVAPTPLALGALPDGLGLQGGVTYSAGDAAYVAASARTALRASASFTLAGVDISRVTLTSDLRSAALTVSRRVSVNACDLALPMIVDAGARVTASGSALLSLAVLSGGAAELIDATVAQGMVNSGGVTLVGRSEVQADEVGIAQDGGVLELGVDARVSGGEVGVRVGRGAVALLRGAVVVNGDDDVDVAGVVLAGGTVELAGAAVTADGARATGVVVEAGTLSGQAVISARGREQATGLHALAPFGGVVGGQVSASAPASLGLNVIDGAFSRLRLRATGADAVGVQAQTATLASSLVVSDGVGARLSGGLLRHVTIAAEREALVADGARGPTVVHNTLTRSPLGVAVAAGAAATALTLGVVGFVDVFDPTSLGCASCVVGPQAALDDDLGLVGDAELGQPNPFVDVGNPEHAEPFDVDGRPIPAATPDLGGLERL